MKKTDELSLQNTALFAQECYQEKTTKTGEALYVHCKNVARQAEKIAHKFYGDLRADCLPENPQELIAAIVHCSFLREVLNVSACSFETIAESTNVQVAAMVAALSRDFRLIETKRDIEFRGRLSQSSVSAQIVAVADIICLALSAQQLLKDSGLPAIPVVKKTIAQLDGDLLAVHAANKYYVLRLYVHAARNMIGDIGKAIKVCKHDAKIKKLTLHTAKKVRESQRDAQSKMAAKSKPKKAKKKATRKPKGS
jgi:hypothetical protein